MANGHVTHLIYSTNSLSHAEQTCAHARQENSRPESSMQNVSTDNSIQLQCDKDAGEHITRMWCVPLH